ncbi:MAG: hypothetical protein JJU02_12640 [Cryomorphaceae bacterium]|nr:hypothetical protein [Cryomorphaceae bacterium]
MIIYSRMTLPWPKDLCFTFYTWLLRDAHKIQPSILTMKKSPQYAIMYLLAPLAILVLIILQFMVSVIFSTELNASMPELVFISLSVVAIVSFQILYIWKAYKIPDTTMRFVWVVLLVGAFVLSFIPFWYIYIRTASPKNLGS